MVSSIEMKNLASSIDMKRIWLGATCSPDIGFGEGWSMCCPEQDLWVINGGRDLLSQHLVRMMRQTH